MNTLPIEAMVDQVMKPEVQELLEMLPDNGAYQAKFTQAGKNWIFRFSFASVRANFSAVGSGPNPTEAFSAAKLLLLRQIRRWQKCRFTLDTFSGEQGFPQASSPSVLIIDDDMEVALATEFMFKQLGCRTQIVCEPESVHRKLSTDETIDLILLDWKLSPELEGADVLERANRLIGTFSDLRAKFENANSRVITHSVLPKSEIKLPIGGYFRHLDHWQKPLPYSELLSRGSDALEACGF